MSNLNITFNSLDDLVNSDLEINEKILRLPILIISNDSNTRDSIGMLFEKKGFKKVVSAKNTLETIVLLKKNAHNNNLLKFCIADIDIGEKYFYKEDFHDLPGLDPDSFWKNCIEQKIMTIIGNVGIPISYDDFIRKLQKFGTVDDSLVDNMKQIQAKAKIFDTKLLIHLLDKQNVVSEMKPFFILKQTNEPHFVELNKQIMEEFQTSVFVDPINAESVCNKLIMEFEALLNKKQGPQDIKAIELELPLTEAQKEELMTNFQVINSLIDQRTNSIAVKYNNKIDTELIKETKRQIYKIMAHYAIKNELQYFQFFFRGVKGIFAQLEDEMKFSDIRQAFLFQNILNRIKIMDYQKIREDIKQCGIIIILIVNNFLLMEKQKIQTVNKFDAHLFYRALGLIFLWPDEYVGQFLSILKNAPNYYAFFLNKDNREKKMNPQDYQSLQGRFTSFTHKAYQVEKCSNLEKRL